MEERGMNARIKALRKLSLDTPAHIDLERALSETATYKKYEGELSVPELRGQVLKDYFSTKTLYIGEGELIVGRKGIPRRRLRHFRSCAVIQWKICMS